MSSRPLAWLAVAVFAAAVPYSAAAADLVFSVTEGVTYQATPKEIRDKFEPLALALGAALKRNVRVVLVPKYDDVRAGLAKQEYDLAFIHPAHVALAEVKAGRYKTLAWTDGLHRIHGVADGEAERPGEGAPRRQGAQARHAGP